MTEWSEECLSKAELAMAVVPGTWREKIAAALDAAVEQREADERELRRQRAEEKMKELEGRF